jgi:hypothetical protein
VNRSHRHDRLSRSIRHKKWLEPIRKQPQTQ